MQNKRSKFLYCTAVSILFIFILICNLLTPLAVDDFSYSINFATKEPIRTVFDIFPSMAAHAVKMNGRLTAHSLVQLFLLLPSFVFEILNSAVFAAMIVLIQKLAQKKDHSVTGYDTLFFAAVFGAVWVFCPSFGEVTFWLTGAINYLWFILFAILYLLPYVSYFRDGTEISSTLKKVLYVIFAFFVGAYLENGSAAVIGMSVLFTAFAWIVEGRRPKLYQTLAIVFSCLGFISIFLSPAELHNKGGEALSLKVLRENFINATDAYAEFAPLILTFAALFALAVYLKKDRKAIITSVIFFLGSLAANYILIAASYYPGRCAYSVVIFLVISVSILISELSEGSLKSVFVCLFAVMIAVSLYYLIIGINDIYVTGVEMLRAEKTVLEAVRNGESSVTLPMIYTKTKYSAINELKYIDISDSESWPNHSMARYYGLGTVYGTP